jgi:hypothetical protein
MARAPAKRVEAAAAARYEPGLARSTSGVTQADAGCDFDSRSGGASRRARIHCEECPAEGSSLVAAIMQGGSGGKKARSRGVSSIQSSVTIRMAIRVRTYPSGWRRLAAPNTSPTIVLTATRSRSSTAIGVRRVIGEFATRLGIRKPQTSIAMVGLRNCGHLGRLGDGRKWPRLPGGYRCTS